MGPGKSIRRVAVFTLIVCLFLDLQAPWFDDAAALGTAVLIAGVFWLLREHLALILVSLFATVLVTSALTTPGGQYVDHWTVTEQGGDDAATASGMIVHLILDEFAGLAGIPDDIAGGRELKAEIKEFFQSYGFSLQTRAISEYASSRASISGMLNFDAGEAPEKHYHGKHPFIMKNNAYFEHLHQRGYKINVYQSTYLDFCAETPVPLASCFNYRYDGTDWLRTATLSDFRKMSVLLGMYLNLPGLFESGWKSYVKLRGQAQRIGVSLPTILAWDGNPSPITAVSALDHLREPVLEAPQGTAHFAHLLLPHGPYVYDAECNLRGPPFGWLSSHPLHEKDNTQAGRALRYQQYFVQVQCTLRQLQQLFDGLKAEGKWADTEIILHSDHGSRIYATAPRSKNRERLNAQDLADGFNTLFAVKSPHAQAIADDTTVPVSRLLARLIGADVQASGEDHPPVVYLQSQDDEPWMAFPWEETR